MTITYTTTRCHYCSREMPIAELYHDGKSFITCRDAILCLAEVQRQGAPIRAAILLELQQVNTKRGELLNELRRVEQEYNLPDLAGEENRAEFARMSAEDMEC